MVSGPINCVKYLVFIFNLIFFLFGIALVAVGSYVQAEIKDFLNVFDSDVSGPAVVLIVIGLLIFIISFFGCCGAIKENYCMVLTFSFLMMIILICQIGGAIAGFVYSHKITDIVNEQLVESMKHYGIPGEGDEPEVNGVTRSWDLIQSEFKCCGAKGPKDWQENGLYEGHKTAPPKSCCNSTKTDTSATKCTYEINILGCSPKLEQFFEKNVYYIGAVGISLAVIQVTGIVLSCCLARAVRKEYDVE